jgi:hypothetical protein
MMEVRAKRAVVAKTATPQSGFRIFLVLSHGSDQVYSEDTVMMKWQTDGVDDRG